MQSHVSALFTLAINFKGMSENILNLPYVTIFGISQFKRWIAFQAASNLKIGISKYFVAGLH